MTTVCTSGGTETPPAEPNTGAAGEAPEQVSLKQPSYFLGWTFSRLVFRVYFRWKVCNPEHVPLSGPVILASNHQSYLDPPLIGAGVRRPLHYLARETLFRYPLARQLLRSWNSVPVDREGASPAGLRVILQLLSAGHAIILFPEGTRSRDGRFQPARSGIGFTVIKSGAPVIPVRVFGTYEALGRHRRWPRPSRVAVKYGRPLEFQAERQAAAGSTRNQLREIYENISGTIMNAIAQLELYEEKTTFP